MELFRIRSPSILWTLIFSWVSIGWERWGGHLWAREHMRTCAKASGFGCATERTDGSKRAVFRPPVIEPWCFGRALNPTSGALAEIN